MNYDGRKLPGVMKGFDKVLLDAPCTGLGVISRDPSIKANRVISFYQTLMDVKKAAHMQRELLRAAVDCCKVGGTIVYSTCSIAAEENEGVIDYILKRRYVKIVETGLPIDKEGITSYEGQAYDPRVKLSRRVYPHMHNMDGFFIAKLIKHKDGARPDEAADKVAKPVRKISTKGLGKRDRLKLKNKGKKANLSKPVPDTIEETTHQEEPTEEVPLEKRKASLKEKIALLKKKKLQ